MIFNGQYLLDAAPILNMERTKVSDHGVSYGLGEAGYDIRIKQTIHFSTVSEKRVVYLDIYDELGQITDAAEMLTGRFALASAMEQFQMPNNMVAIVHDKSTWARRGLSVFNTVIEPGWHGFLTLELVYHGNEELIIPAGAGIAQVMFHEVKAPAVYTGKYQFQDDRPVAAIKSE